MAAKRLTTVFDRSFRSADKDVSLVIKEFIDQLNSFDCSVKKIKQKKSYPHNLAKIKDSILESGVVLQGLIIPVAYKVLTKMKTYIENFRIDSDAFIDNFKNIKGEEDKVYNQLIFLRNVSLELNSYLNNINDKARILTDGASSNIKEIDLEVRSVEKKVMKNEMNIKNGNIVSGSGLATTAIFLANGSIALPLALVGAVISYGSYKITHAQLIKKEKNIKMIGKALEEKGEHTKVIRETSGGTTGKALNALDSIFDNFCKYFNIFSTTSKEFLNNCESAHKRKDQSKYYLKKLEDPYKKLSGWISLYLANVPIVAARMERIELPGKSLETVIEEWLDKVHMNGYDESIQVLKQVYK